MSLISVSWFLIFIVKSGCFEFELVNFGHVPRRILQMVIEDNGISAECASRFDVFEVADVEENL